MNNLEFEPRLIDQAVHDARFAKSPRCGQQDVAILQLVPDELYQRLSTIKVIAADRCPNSVNHHKRPFRQHTCCATSALYNEFVVFVNLGTSDDVSL
jgi:hypothetical protein